MKALEDTVHLLESLITTDENRMDRIRDFEDALDQLLLSEALDECVSAILRDLRIDLAFYEPDPVGRAEDQAYFGDNQLVESVSAALEAIRVFRSRAD